MGYNTKQLIMVVALIGQEISIILCWILLQALLNLSFCYDKHLSLVT